MSIHSKIEKFLSTALHRLGELIERASLAGCGRRQQASHAPQPSGAHEGTPVPVSSPAADEKGLHESCVRELAEVRAVLEQHAVEAKAGADRAESERLRLLKRIGEIMDELDEVIQPGGEIADFAEELLNRFEDILTHHGVERIEGDSDFDILRHKAVGTARAAAGASIKETLRPGFACGKEVLRRAHVSVLAIPS